jgi:putative endonuclease
VTVSSSGAGGSGTTGRAQPDNYRQQTGRAGEDRAAAWYVAAGYEVVARNWRCRQGELDLVAVKGRTYVFCEVKTRRTDAFGVPATAVTPAKQARIRRLAALWLSEQARGRARVLRFDVVGILAGELEVIEGAF